MLGMQKGEEVGESDVLTFGSDKEEDKDEIGRPDEKELDKEWDWDNEQTLKAMNKRDREQWLEKRKKTTSKISLPEIIFVADSKTWVDKEGTNTKKFTPSPWRSCSDHLLKTEVFSRYRGGFSLTFSPSTLFLIFFINFTFSNIVTIFIGKNYIFICRYCKEILSDPTGKFLNQDRGETFIYHLEEKHMVLCGGGLKVLVMRREIMRGGEMRITSFFFDSSSNILFLCTYFSPFSFN